MIRGIFRGGLLALFMIAGMAFHGFAAAQGKPEASPGAGNKQEQITNEQQAAAEAAIKVLKRGPSTIPLGEQGSIDLPAGKGFVPQPEASRYLHSLGNTPSPQIIGIIVPLTGKNESWLALVQFQKTGYIKDGDAANWDVSELLQSLKDSTEAGNADRATRGFQPREVVGWVERPDYNAADHRLVWSVNTREKGVKDSDNTVNYNTYTLGREGYFSLNFVTSLSSIEAEKPIARELLGALSYNPGKRYADYNSATDNVAGYGIAALVAGGAAKKLGLFAVFGAFLLKAGKILIIPLLAGIALLGKLFRSNKDAA